MKTVRNLRQFSKEDWKNPFGLALIGYYLVMAVVGLLIPDDILTANAWAVEFSDFMASIVPQIDRITALGIKPDMNRFYFSVLWAGSPWSMTPILWGIWQGWRRNIGTIWTAPLQRNVLPMSFALFAILISLNPLLFGPPTTRFARFMFGSDIGRGFFAQAFVLGPQLFGSVLLAWTIGWITGYIPRRIKEQNNG